MIKSAAIVKTKTLSPRQELRLQKRKLKKLQTKERKASKQVHPSPMSSRVRHEAIEEAPKDDSPPTRDEMLQQAETIGLKVDKRWSDATLLKNIEELQWATPNDNS
jgi:hypothetical protein